MTTATTDTRSPRRIRVEEEHPRFRYYNGLNRDVEIADLNKPLDPTQLAHHVNVKEMDEVIMGIRESTIALCGYIFGRDEKSVDVGAYAEAYKPEKKQCPYCFVRYAMRGI